MERLIPTQQRVTPSPGADPQMVESPTLQVSRPPAQHPHRTAGTQGDERQQKPASAAGLLSADPPTAAQHILTPREGRLLLKQTGVPKP